MKLVKFLITAGIIIALWLGALFIMRGKDTGEVPVITVPEGVLKCDVDVSDKKLLKGVTATDKEDGSLTKKVFIESLSNLNTETSERTVTYAVFDDDDNVARATRTIKYNNYTAPKWSLKQAMCGYYSITDTEMLDYLKCKSSVDGNISSKISLDKQYTDEYNTVWYTFSVEDSCGSTTSIDLCWTYTSRETEIEIQLTKYLVYIDQGDSFDATDYVKHIVYGTIPGTTMYPSLKYDDSEVDTSKPGVYEVFYKINYQGEIGETKLIVIVE